MLDAIRMTYNNSVAVMIFFFVCDSEHELFDLFNFYGNSNEYEIQMMVQWNIQISNATSSDSIDSVFCQLCDKSIKKKSAHKKRLGNTKNDFATSRKHHRWMLCLRFEIFKTRLVCCIYCIISQQ